MRFPIYICLTNSLNKKFLFNDLISPYLFFQCGYTFVAEAITPESPPIGAKWRIRLIGLSDLLPKLSRETPLNTFSVKEYRDYYITNDKNLICR